MPVLFFVGWIWAGGNRQPEIQFNQTEMALAAFRLIFVKRLPLRLIAARRLTFLCFAKEK